MVYTFPTKFIELSHSLSFYHQLLGFGLIFIPFLFGGSFVIQTFVEAVAFNKRKWVFDLG